MTESLPILSLALVAVVTLTAACDVWKNDMSWCFHSGSKVHVGDFNGDSLMDLLCHDKSGDVSIAFADRSGGFSDNKWHSAMGWCNNAGYEFHIGDFNGDGRSDMLCHGITTGYKSIAYANTKGNFAGSRWELDTSWCSHSGSKIFIGDFNGDGRDDLMCHDTKGNKWISSADKNGAFTGGSTWHKALDWCGGHTLHLGDFNGDSNTDMLCHDPKSGEQWIAFASCDGTFTGTSWHQSTAWCSHSGAKLYVEDFNGDGRDDMLCHDATGYVSIAYSNVDGNFADGTGWKISLKWCYHSLEKLFVGDFDGDNHSDMLCHDTGDGYKMIAFANLTGTFEP